MGAPGLDMARLCREHLDGEDAVFSFDGKESWPVGAFLSHTPLFHEILISPPTEHIPDGVSGWYAQAWRLPQVETY